MILLFFFCARLAFGLLGSLLLLLPFEINPRFYHAHFLIALALSAGALLLAINLGNVALWLTLPIQLGICLLGSVVWNLRDAPGGRWLIGAGAAVSAAVAAFLCLLRADHRWFFLADDLTSAVFLGTAVTSMLLGHSYLNVPTMSIKPLKVLLAALGVCLLLRIVVAGIGLWSWTAEAPANNLNSMVTFWLIVRWIVGIGLPMVLGWMTWETARIRSTQSATGILYVLVICSFLGELSSLIINHR